MSQDMTLFDYTGLPSEAATEIRAAAERIRVRMKRTAEDIIEIGRDLIAVKAKLAHGQFLPWIEAEFGMGDDTARNFMNVAKKLGDQIPKLSGFAPSALYLLASAPAEVVTAVETRAQSGEPFDVAKIKAEIAAAKAAEAAANDGLEAFKVEAAKKQAAASRRETNLLERAVAAEKAAATIAAETSLKVQSALAERIAKAEAEARAAREQAAETTRTLATAVAKATADAEQAARDNAEAMAAAALAKTRSEAEKWEAKAAEALRKNEGYSAALADLQAKVKEHRELVDRIGNDEYEAMAEIKIADSIIMEMNVSMVAMVDLEDAIPQPNAIHKLEVARQMCAQMAEALGSFLDRPSRPRWP
ncbi:MAG: DUF3102 domain-containing protein [Alphaproteobacteria bacterium]|nr:DUF3102 domain-containing protein [Alphaproteobacteria bacterium]